MSLIIKRDRYKRGDWNLISDQSGQKYKASNTRTQWNGLQVGIDEFENRHPQDIIRPRPDNPARWPVRNTEPGNLYIVPPFPQPQPLITVVLDSDGDPYKVTNIVTDERGKDFAVSPYVTDEDGDEFLIFMQQTPTIGV